MMTWNYRVFREDNGDHIIREVFYDQDGAVIGCTADAVEPIGRSFKELAEDIASFQTALQLPVLTLADIPKAEASSERLARDRSQNRRIEDVMRELEVELASDEGER